MNEMVPGPCKMKEAFILVSKLYNPHESRHFKNLEIIKINTPNSSIYKNIHPFLSHMDDKELDLI